MNPRKTSATNLEVGAFTGQGGGRRMLLRGHHDGVYCRPGCASRLPLRRNVAFYESTDAAERAGYRPCKRCRPAEAA